MEFKKVNKAVARKMYNWGLSIYLLPCKYRFIPLNEDGFIHPCEINILTCDETENKFDRLVRSFEYYNCNSELGYYASYYVKEPDYSSFQMCNLMC